MARQSNEEIARAYAAAHERHDAEVMEQLRHPDWAVDIPQSGERIRGHANDRAIMDNWPGGRPVGDIRRVVGSEDRWVLTPSWTYQRVSGEGENWSAEAIANYPDGSTWHAVILFDLRDGKVFRERWYFGPPLEAPAWRAQWVERIEPEERSNGR